MNKIALLTYPYLQSFFEDVITPFRDQCDIDIHTFDKQYSLLDMIPSLISQYQGLCIFSASAYPFLRQSSIELKKPVVFLDRHSVDYFKTLSAMFIKNRNVDFSRVILDTSLVRMDAVRTLENLTTNLELFEDHRINFLEDLSPDDFYNMEDKIEENALDYWRMGKYDMILCRLANVASLMEKEGIPFMFVYPEKYRIEESLENLLNRIRLEKQKEGLPASIMIFTDGDILSEYYEINQESIRIQKALLEFSKNYTSNFTIQFASQGYEILTSHLVIQRITSDFSCCQLGYYLFSTIGLTFRIGYGIGHDIASARINALNAGKAASESGMSCLVSENGNMVPLQARPSSSEINGQNNSASYLSSRTGLSPITLQRIRSALEFLGTNEVTNHELAEALQVTVANANRFLHSLLRSGHALILDTKKSSAKGRPSRIYRIQL
ncbi:MAG: hypothetical protein FWH28_08105 [Clostridiales bacterium]|nr:hypothetical protein [Clostridiales bacterium]